MAAQSQDEVEVEEGAGRGCGSKWKQHSVPID